jgi:hypothetical protein
MYSKYLHGCTTKRGLGVAVAVAACTAPLRLKKGQLILRVSYYVYGNRSGGDLREERSISFSSTHSIAADCCSTYCVCTYFCSSTSFMAPVAADVVRIATMAARDLLVRRDVSVQSDAQKVTIGVIVAYVVIIALLWNIPYVRMVLWPFKASLVSLG